MKILLSAIPFDNGKSGISVYIREVVKALESQGHELTLIVEDDGAEEFKRFDLIRIKKTTGIIFHAVQSVHPTLADQLEKV